MRALGWALLAWAAFLQVAVPARWIPIPNEIVLGLPAQLAAVVFGIFCASCSFLILYKAHFRDVARKHDEDVQ